MRASETRLPQDGIASEAEALSCAGAAGAGAGPAAAGAAGAGAAASEDAVAPVAALAGDAPSAGDVPGRVSAVFEDGASVCSAAAATGVDPAAVPDPSAPAGVPAPDPSAPKPPAPDAPAPAGKKTTVTIAGREVQKGDVVKFAALIAAILLICGILFALWPLVADAFGEGGVGGLVSRIRESGPWGVLALLLLQFLQVLVAFIPGEAVQFAAGALYGPIGGTVIVLVGCAVSSAVVYKLVHALGAPFVQSMVSPKYMDKFRDFEHSGKLGALVFILYLIPGLPKDTFSYLVPLTDMKLKVFVGLTTLARIPGVLASCLVANGLLEGSYGMAAVVAGVVVVLVVLCIIFRKPLMAWMQKISQ